jgi:hypothetical protein
MTGVDDGQRRDFLYRIAPIMTVLAETFRNEPGPHTQEEGDPYQENADHSDQVSGIFESIHSRVPLLHVAVQALSLIFHSLTI